MAPLIATHLQTIRLSAAPQCRVPLRCGVPFAKGQFDAQKQQLIIRAADQEIASQVRPLMNWSDESVQWALVDWLAEPNVEAYEVELAHGVANQEELPSNIQQNHDSFEVADIVATLPVCLDDGRTLSSKVTEKQVIDGGKVRKSTRLTGCCVDADGKEVLEWFLHVHTFAKTSLQQWMYTIRNPSAAAHPGGIWELGDANSIHIQSALVSAKHKTAEIGQGGAAKVDEEGHWKTFDNALRIEQLGSGGDNYKSKIHRDKDGKVYAPAKGYIFEHDELAADGLRSTPAVVVGSENGIGFYCDKFWQNFPKALRASSGTIQFELFPVGFGKPQELQPGEQKTHEFWLATGKRDEVQDALEQVRSLPSVLLDPQVVCETGVLAHLSPQKDDPKEYSDLINQALVGGDTFFDKRESIDVYGWRDFGDVFGDHEAVNSPADDPLISHYNNQYDLVLGLGIQWLRGGDQGFLDLMRDLARHVIDIDLYHTDRDLLAYNHGQFWHTVHYVDAGTSTHRSYPEGTCGGGPSSGQAYSRGLLLHYCMTGDESAREAVMNMGRWMIASEDGSATKYRWLADGETGLTTASGTDFYHGPGRGPANSVETLVTAFQLTRSREFLDQAEHTIRRVVHPDHPVEELNLLDVENRWFYTMFLQALGRYLDAKLELQEVDEMYTYGRRVLLNIADWMVEHEYPYLEKPEILEFPNETWSGQEMRKCESLQWAAKFADSDRRRTYLQKARFFFDTACQQLLQSPRRSLCRPVVLLLTNGYSRTWFQTHGDTLPRLPEGLKTDFPPKSRFTTQKQRAILRVKQLAIAASVATLVIAFVLWMIK